VVIILRIEAYGVIEEVSVNVGSRRGTPVGQWNSFKKIGETSIGRTAIVAYGDCQSFVEPVQEHAEPQAVSFPLIEQIVAERIDVLEMK
jgi:hypothetical protein